MLDHPRRQAVSEDVRTGTTGRQKAGALHGVPRDLAHVGWLGQSDARGDQAQEHAPRAARTARRAQVEGQRLSHVGEQWQAVVEPALSVHDDLAGLPAEVIELQCEDLAGAQSESCQEQQDREVAAPACRRTVSYLDHLLYLLSREEGRGGHGLPPADRGNGSGEISRNGAVEETKT